MQNLDNTIRTKELLIKHLENLMVDKRAEIDRLSGEIVIEANKLQELRFAKNILRSNNVDYK